jgi:ribosomal protein S27AE
VGEQYLDAFASIDKGVGTALALVPQQGGDDAAHALTPTEQVYGALQSGFTFFNASLFANKLPDCLITLQRDRGAYGYFCASRIVAAGDVARIADEIALNPVHFAVRTAMETFSTLVHEMVHCAQQHFGAPSPHGYHNLEFAGLMRRVGLEPSDTGKPGGKPTGRRVSHYIIAGGPFDRAYQVFEAAGLTIGWGDAQTQGLGDASQVTAPPKRKRLDFDCPRCGQQTAQATPKTRIKCGDCDAVMVARPGGAP